jgi:hypothetical protein
MVLNVLFWPTDLLFLLVSGYHHKKPSLKSQAVAVHILLTIVGCADIPGHAGLDRSCAGAWYPGGLPVSTKYCGGWSHGVIGIRSTAGISGKNKTR